MANLQGLKNYCRVDYDDDALESFLIASKEYIKNAGVPEQTDNKLYDLLVYMLAGHWYNKRETVVVGSQLHELPFAIVNILIQLRESVSDG